MKKVWLFLITLLCCATVAWADSAAPDLVFTPDGSGKYIYCNNHEFIRRQDLSDISNKDATYIMNNDDLSKGKYAMFISHVNHTEQVDESGAMIGPGFDIEVDVQFIAKEDTTFTITALGFEVPENKRYYLNGTEYTYEDAWGCMNAWATYKQIPLYEIDSGQKYQPAAFDPITVHVAKGQQVWLSQYIDNYRSVPFYRPVHIMADFEIESGAMDVNIAALKSNGTLKDRSHHNPNAKRGRYERDYQYKGVADSLNSVSTELKFSIDDNTWSGSLLPVKVYNQYVPEGNEVTQWTTHINPLADAWSKNTGTESDMLAFHYNDGTKESYYGGSVPESERDPVWHFDTSHSDYQEYPGRVSGFTAARYEPNFEIPAGSMEEGLYPCNLGNYGVSVNYKITIENSGERTRFVNYKLATTSNNIVILRDAEGNPVNAYGLCKGAHTLKETDVMASVELPPKQTTTFWLEVILPTNYAGGMENSLEINDVPTPILIYESPREEVSTPYCYTGREYVKWQDGGLYRSEDLISWEQIPLNEETKQIFSGTWDEFELLYTGDGYMAKPTLYDAIPYYGAQDYFKRVYFLNEDFQLQFSHEFSGYPSEMGYAKGCYYVRIWGTPYYSENGTDWTLFDGPIPKDNFGTYAVAFEDGNTFISTDGKAYYPVVYEGEAPRYVERSGGLYYYGDGNNLSLSKDGAYWVTQQTEEEIQSVSIAAGVVFVNGAPALTVPELEDQIVLMAGGTVLAFSQPPKEQDGRVIVPARHLLEQMGAQVNWNGQDQSVEIAYQNKKIELQVGSNKAYVNGQEVEMEVPPELCGDQLFVPVRFVAEAMGCEVEWDEAAMMVMLN